MSKIYHVAKDGSDRNQGDERQPFLTIQRAADEAVAGDTILVHAGEYREWVKPRYGGLDDNCRIIYRTAGDGRVVIKGSEQICGWEPVGDQIWKATIDNTLFGDYNPYATEISGDWLVDPRESLSTQEMSISTGYRCLRRRIWRVSVILSGGSTALMRHGRCEKNWSGMRKIP